MWINHIHIKTNKQTKIKKEVVSQWPSAGAGGESLVFLYGENISVALSSSIDLALKSACGEECTKFQSFCLVMFFDLMEPL